MKKSLLFLSLIIVSIINIFIVPANSQQPPCYPTYMGLSYSAEMLDHTPALTTDMPYDVMLGYVAFDSLIRYARCDDFKSFSRRQTYNDTLKTIMKYYYKMVDYNPIHFIRTSMAGYTYCVSQYDVRNFIDYAYWKHTQDLAGYLAISSLIIAWVRADDYIQFSQPEGADPPEEGCIVNCTIIDTIKGKVIPICKDVNLGSVPTAGEGVDNGMFYGGQEAKAGACLQFEYRLNLESGGHKFIDSTGKLWIEKDKEYIVFLEYNPLCLDSSNCYYGINPTTLKGTMGSLYPVIDGKVYDPNDDFGFGTGLTVQEFISQFRERIDQIRNYGQ